MNPPLTPHPQEPRVTTVVENIHRPSVEPYAASPLLDIPEGVIACQYCGNTRFRRSRVRIFDLREVLLLRYPMRCMRCNQRQYGSYLTAGLALAPKTHGPRIARGSETWKAWTEQELVGTELQRPMSTAVGTKATKLQMPKEPARRARGAGRESGRTPGTGDADRQIW